MKRFWVFAWALLLATPAVARTEAASAPWESLPAPAALPAPNMEGRVSHDGAQIWFSTYGAGPPVILLHAGNASSDLWGGQTPALVADHHRVILIDSRGHGRSTRDRRPLAYEQMEGDVIAVMDALNLDKADVVGWSDGAIIGLIMAMKHPQRVSSVFAFGANMDLKAFNISGAYAHILGKVEARLSADYARLSQTPGDYDAFSKAVFAMQSSQPNYGPPELAAIHGPHIDIVDGEHEEFISRAHTAYLARTIPGAKLLILPGVSHFAPVQDPAEFNAALIGFLDP